MHVLVLGLVYMMWNFRMLYLLEAHPIKLREVLSVCEFLPTFLKNLAVTEINCPQQIIFLPYFRMLKQLLL